MKLNKKFNKKLEMKECPRCLSMMIDTFMNGICSDCNRQRNKIVYDANNPPKLLTSK